MHLCPFIQKVFFVGLHNFIFNRNLIWSFITSYRIDIIYYMLLCCTLCMLLFSFNLWIIIYYHYIVPIIVLYNNNCTYCVFRNAKLVRHSKSINNQYSHFQKVRKIILSPWTLHDDAVKFKIGSLHYNIVIYSYNDIGTFSLLL